jgi:hypothetical protein
MRMKLSQFVWVLAVVLGSGITGGAVRAAASPLPQDRSHDDDYSHNSKFQQGMREGKDDLAHNRDHYKKRHYKKDEDQRAYETGYQEGHRGDQGERHDH